MRFLLQINSLEGTNAARRIQYVIEQGHDATKTYDLKTTSTQLNA